MIDVKELTVTTAGKTILSRLSLGIAPGETVLVRGASGCGKSTLLRALLFFQPFSGTVRLNGNPVGENGIGAYRSGIGFLGQRTPTGEGSAGTVLLAPFAFRANRSRTPAQETVQVLLAKLRLDMDLLKQPFENLSGGEKQRLLLAQVLLLGRKILFLDEPTAALDTANRRRVIRLLCGLPGVARLVVSHDAEWLEAADRRLELAGGRLRSMRRIRR